MSIRLLSVRPKPQTLPAPALELLVDNRVTGLPVVNADNVVVGVVSDYDLLALESFSKATDKSPGAVTGGKLHGGPSSHYARSPAGIVFFHFVLRAPIPGLFPAATTSWKAFQQVKKLLAKSSGKVKGVFYFF